VTPYFSVIIPALNEEINLPILLQSLAVQTDKDFEVIISDDNSTDDTVKLSNSFKDKFVNYQLITHQSACVSKGRNIGAKKAIGKYLIFFDADVEVVPDFIAGIKNHITKHNLDTLSVWNRPKNASWKGKLVLFLLNISMTLAQKIKPVINGPCMIIKKELFHQINGFDETIVFAEDIDLIQRADDKKAKFAIFTQPTIYVSTRRFEKEGLLITLYKAISALIHIVFIGPIRKPIFHYEMGGQYFRKK